ncbi:Dabb family protein [Nocardia sp. NBC_01329]|uniref:Dabb family protein n=1 Tax=Nocardia sp. NBC_01329 TaxID=2903594 RepID=UPI002E14D6A5|nr:Dabb family protein [Nocardia sp. NBC_01329]
MYEVTRLVHLVPDAGPGAIGTLLTELRAAVGAGPYALVEPTLPGVRNGGDILLRLNFAEAVSGRTVMDRVAEVCDRAEVSRIDGADHGPGVGGAAEPRGAGTVFRTLLLRADPAAPAAALAEFEGDLLRMPRHIPTIRAWRLSRVDRATGSAEWTHVWEQEFTDLAGLSGTYLSHPVHWGLVDRWFDPECPESIVRDRVCHSFCVRTRPVLSAAPGPLP